MIELRLTRAQAVVAASLFAVAASVARAALRQFGLPQFPFAYRLLLAGEATSPQMGLLLVVAATLGAGEVRVRRAVQVLGGLLLTLTVVATGNWIFSDFARGAGPRVGTAILQIATGLLAAVAVWLASRPSLNAGGSPLDEGSA